MASNQAAGAKSAKPSFAKIAAAGIKPPSVQSTSSNKSSNTQRHTITSAPRDGTDFVTPSTGSTPPMPQAAHAHDAPKRADALQEPKGSNAPGPAVHVHTVEGTQSQSHDETANCALLAPSASEDANTQDSSSSSSVKPPSVDGKSVASGATFALDEKESLRPDDSASVNATEEEEAFPTPSVSVAEAEAGTDIRAFQDQLREISFMEPSRRGVSNHGYGAPNSQGHGILYIPPQGPGIGAVPASVDVSGEVDCPPHPKLIEALTAPQNRLWVLKLEQDVSDFVKDPKEASFNLPQCNSYQRMLAHKIADYYRLGHAVDESASSVRLFKTPYCRIPPPLTAMTTPSTAASTPPPSGRQVKILRRGDEAIPAIANGSLTPSKAASEAGESDSEQKPRRPVTYEERLANYETVRLRIMGSAKPSDPSEENKPKEGSRSSSAAEKKPKKKQRSDSEDGFDTRSSYNTYYPQTYGTNGFAPPSYGFPAQAGSNSSSNVAPSNAYGSQPSTPGYQPYSMQNSAQGNMTWSGPSLAPGSGAQQWPHQQQQPGYDLSSDFQRAMTFQSAAAGPHQMGMPAGYDHAYAQQYYGSTQGWPQQQQYQMSPYSPMSGSASFTTNPTHPQPSAGQYPDLQPYAFGQLPSQTFPGRPPNRLEHPLPGSYKGKHFNPQSQAFVPGQQDADKTGIRPFTPHNGAPNAGGYGVSSPLQRQTSAHSTNSGFGSPQQHGSVGHPTMHAPPQQQQMMHPLPQPVFPQQPTPSLPLPPKPGSTSQKQSGGQQGGTGPLAANPSQGSSPSSIAKWSAAASSLPAKPPPPAEQFDQNRFQRQPSGYNTAATARVPSGTMPSFGSMPPMGGVRSQVG